MTVGRVRCANHDFFFDRLIHLFECLQRFHRWGLVTVLERRRRLWTTCFWLFLWSMLLYPWCGNPLPQSGQRTSSLSSPCILGSWSGLETVTTRLMIPTNKESGLLFCASFLFVQSAANLKLTRLEMQWIRHIEKDRKHKANWLPKIGGFMHGTVMRVFEMCIFANSKILLPKIFERCFLIKRGQYVHFEVFWGLSTWATCWFK